jgi:Haloacid dehalogenase-like hydrolase
MSYVPSFFVVHLPIERRSEETNKILPIGVRPCLVERGYGVSAFNVKNIEQINAIVDASHAKTERAYDSAVSAGGVSNIVTKSQSVATIVFDLDGTLVDTAPDLVDALNFTLTQNGLSAISHGEARALIGSGMRSMIERALIFATANSRRAEVDTLYRRFLAHYGEHIAERSRPFPGVAVELDRLSACGYRLASAQTNSNPCRGAYLVHLS